MQTTHKQTKIMQAAAACLFIGSALITTGTAQQDHAFIQDDIIGALEWRSLGPTNFGGRIVDIAVDPARQYTWYVATGSGGLWKTTNNGTTFKSIFDTEAVISIGDIAIAPSDGKVIYVGTGEANNQRSSYWGDGIYKSPDGGKTWKHVGLKGTDHIGRIVVHPTEPNIVYVAALGALYKPNKERGLFRSTDGGATWVCVKYVNEDTGFVDVVIDPENPDNLVAASYERRRRAHDFAEHGAGSAIYRSTNGGDSWKKIRGGLPRGNIGRIGLTIYPEDPSILYTIVENNNPRPSRRTGTVILPGAATASSQDRDAVKPSKAEPKASKPKAGTPKAGTPKAGTPKTGNPKATEAGKLAQVDDPDELYPFGEGEEHSAPGDVRRPSIGGEVYKSTDGGKKWKKVNKKPVGGSPHYYYGQIRIDPSDSNRVHVLGMMVSSTSDGGKTWSTRTGRGLHVDNHALWIDPADGKHMLLGNDGGLGITYDRGKAWDYSNDLPIAQFYAIAVDNRVPYTIYGGTQDNGTWGISSRTVTSGVLTEKDAFKIGGGDGFYVQVDPEDPDVIYSESQFGAISRQNLATGQRASIRPRAEKGSPALRFNWMSPILISPHNAKTIYFGSQFLHRSRNRGDKWETISQDLSSNDLSKIAGNVPHCTLTTIAESPLQEGQLWVGTDDGKVWMSRNGGDRWIDLTDRIEGIPKNLWVSRIEASPSDDKTAYVSFTGYREDIRKPYLFITTDAGETFRSITNNLPESPVNVIREHPRNSEVLFVGTESCVQVSIDGGGHWYELGAGLPTNAVHDLLVHPEEMDLIIGTHGRGIYVLDIAMLEELSSKSLRSAIVVAPPRDGMRTSRAYPSIRYRGTAPWQADRVDSNAIFRYVLTQDSDEAVKVEVLDATGKVLLSRKGRTGAGLQEVSWQARSQGRSRGGASPAGAGHYLMRITHGEKVYERSFRVLQATKRPTTFGIAEEGLELENDEENEGAERHDDI